MTIDLSGARRAVHPLVTKALYMRMDVKGMTGWFNTFACTRGVQLDTANSRDGGVMLNYLFSTCGGHN